MINRIIYILYFIMIPLIGFGQLTPATYHYILDPLASNPAYAGTGGALNIAAFFSNKWSSIAGSPETKTLVIDTPLGGDRIGLGFIIINNKTGLIKETEFTSDYAFKIYMGESILSLGVGAGVISTNTEWSDLTAPDRGDEYYLIGSQAFLLPTFGFGVYYSYKKYYMGVSVPEFLSYSFNFDKNKYDLANDPDLYNYKFLMGFDFNSNPRFGFYPSALLTYSVHNNKLLYDINLHYNFNNRFWIGTSFRNNRSVAGIFQFQINNQCRMAYSHDFDMGKLGSYSNGSNEIMLRYEFKYKLDVVNPLNF